MLDFLFYAFIFIFGLIIGSFLNCVIYRLKTKESIVSSRSHCPKCGHKLSWKDLVPVLGFLSLKGKCRYCFQKISWQYPAVEIMTALLFLLIVFYFSFDLLSAAYYLLLASFLVVILVYDLKYYLIADEIIYSAIAIVFLERILRFAVNYPLLSVGEAILNPLISALSAAAFFAAMVFVSKEQWMGWGDVSLAFFMGLFLGFPNILLALFLAFMLGALVGIVLIIFGRKKMKSQVPFAPFLVWATFIALFWGERIIAWYLELTTAL